MTTWLQRRRFQEVQWKLQAQLPMVLWIFLWKPTFSLWKLLRSKSFFNVLAAEVRNCFLFVSAGSKTLIHLIRVLLSVKFDVYEKDGETLHSQGVKRSLLTQHTSHCFHTPTCISKKASWFHTGATALFIRPVSGTEITTDTVGKTTWAKCQIYNYLAKSTGKIEAFNDLYIEFGQKK